MSFTRQGLTFREVEPEDLQLLRTQRNLYWQGYRNPASVQTMWCQEKWYESLNSENQAYMVIDSDIEKPYRVGLLRISQFDHENRSVSLVGCDVFRDFQGKGYATRIMRAAAEYLIDELGYHRVKGECIPSNTAMIKALENAGFRHEGTQRERIWRGGKWHDFLQFSLLAGEL